MRMLRRSRPERAVSRSDPRSDAGDSRLKYSLTRPISGRCGFSTSCGLCRGAKFRTAFRTDMHEDSVASPVMAEEAAKGIRLPPCPAILTKLLREMRADDPNFRNIAKLISTDVS